MFFYVFLYHVEVMRFDFFTLLLAEIVDNIMSCGQVQTK